MQPSAFVGWEGVCLQQQLVGSGARGRLNSLVEAVYKSKDDTERVPRRIGQEVAVHLMAHAGRSKQFVTKVWPTADLHTITLLKAFELKPRKGQLYL